MVRFKQRYLLVNVHFDGGVKNKQISNKDVYSAISGVVNRVFGIWGYGCVKASLMIKYWNPDTGMLIVRIGRDFLKLGWNAINCVTEVANIKCIMSVIHCGGTIRVAKKVLLKQQSEVAKISK